MKLVPTNENKEIMKNYEQLRSKIRDLIKLITNSSDDDDDDDYDDDDYDDDDEKYMKTKFNLNNYLPLNKVLEFLKMAIIVRAIFLK